MQPMLHPSYQVGLLRASRVDARGLGRKRKDAILSPGHGRFRLMSRANRDAQRDSDFLCVDSLDCGALPSIYSAVKSYQC
jgi:hypothetical protein